MRLANGRAPSRELTLRQALPTLVDKFVCVRADGPIGAATTTSEGACTRMADRRLRAPGAVLALSGAVLLALSGASAAHAPARAAAHAKARAKVGDRRAHARANWGTRAKRAADGTTYASILPAHSFLAFGSGFARTSSAASFLHHTADVTAFAPWGFALFTNGSAVERGGGAVAPVVAAAHRAGRAVLPLFTNAYGNDSILRNAGARAAALRSLVSIVKTDGLDGVNIDFEGLNPVDRTPLVRFVQAVSAALHPLGRIVTVSVGPEWAAERAQYKVYDYAGLARAADRIVIMTYDQHSNPGGPGPVAGLPWVRAALAYAVSQIPAAKVYLGLADYGYDWYGSSAPTLTAAQAIALAARVGATIRWSNRQGEAYFAYTSASGASHIVWFEDGASEALRIRLAEADHIGGVALWQLGGEDPGTWRWLARYDPAAPSPGALQ